MENRPFAAVKELTDAIAEAEALERAVGERMTPLARILLPRLRSVWDNETLAALKRELADYNIHKRSWKGKV